jgi:hypothetical protein
MKSFSRNAAGRFEPNVQTYDPFDDRATFEYVYCVWPRRCYTTGQWLFMELAMRGRRVITGPGEPVIEDRWFHRNEAIIKMLKGN